jgi:hypothetical protein
VLAYADAFWLLAMMFALLVFAVPLMRRVHTGPIEKEGVVIEG